MKRWNGIEYVEMPAVDDFIEEVISVCKKHRMSISHEDEHGAFEIEPFSESDADWLRDASAKRIKANTDLHLCETRK